MNWPTEYTENAEETLASGWFRAFPWARRAQQDCALTRAQKRTVAPNWMRQRLAVLSMMALAGSPV